MGQFIGPGQDFCMLGDLICIWQHFIPIWPYDILSLVLHSLALITTMTIILVFSSGLSIDTKLPLSHMRI